MNDTEKIKLAKRRKSELRKLGLIKQYDHGQGNVNNPNFALDNHVLEFIKLIQDEKVSISGLMVDEIKEKITSYKKRHENGEIKGWYIALDVRSGEVENDS